MVNCAIQAMDFTTSGRNYVHCGSVAAQKQRRGQPPFLQAAPPALKNDSVGYDLTLRGERLGCAGQDGGITRAQTPSATW